MNADRTPRRGRWYWETFSAENRYAHADLAALRKGLGRRAGSVPQMWRFYRSVTSDGVTSSRLSAEHAALTLFATHQQSQHERMHQQRIGLGRAVRRPDRVAHAPRDDEQPDGRDDAGHRGLTTFWRGHGTAGPGPDRPTRGPDRPT